MIGADLRQPEVDETPLSVQEVLHGLRDGSIAPRVVIDIKRVAELGTEAISRMDGSLRFSACRTRLLPIPITTCGQRDLQVSRNSPMPPSTRWPRISLPHFASSSSKTPAIL